MLQHPGFVLSRYSAPLHFLQATLHILDHLFCLLLVIHIFGVSFPQILHWLLLDWCYRDPLCIVSFHWFIFWPQPSSYILLGFTERPDHFHFSINLCKRDIVCTTVSVVEDMSSMNNLQLSCCFTLSVFGPFVYPLTESTHIVNAKADSITLIV